MSLNDGTDRDACLIQYPKSHLPTIRDICELWRDQRALMPVGIQIQRAPTHRAPARCSAAGHSHVDSILICMALVRPWNSSPQDIYITITLSF